MGIKGREGYYEAQKLLQANQLSRHILCTQKGWLNENAITRIKKAAHPPY